MKVYINTDFDDSGKFHAGRKAPRDAEVIFEKNGFRPLLPVKKVARGSVKTALSLSWHLMKLSNLTQSDELMVNFPINGKIGKLIFDRIVKSKKKYGFKLILLVHDVAGFHSNGEGKRDSFTEIVEVADVLIVHSPAMQDWFLKFRKTHAKFVILGCFDYLMSDKNVGGKFGNALIVAGSLSPWKSHFLTEVAVLPEIMFHLYGTGLDEKVAKFNNVHYFGKFPPTAANEERSILTKGDDSLEAQLTGTFGLVWNSEHLQGGQGRYGRYERYNAAHKFSLYLASNFPVIVWKEAALAEIVVQEKIGIVLDSLQELPQRLSCLTEEDYAEIKKNVNKFGQKLRQGYFLTQALKEIDDYFLTRS